MSEKLELLQAVSVIAYCVVEHLLGKTPQGSLLGLTKTGLLSLIKALVSSAKIKIEGSKS
jgi:hypothetical protein